MSATIISAARAEASAEPPPSEGEKLSVHSESPSPQKKLAETMRRAGRRGSLTTQLRDARNAGESQWSMSTSLLAGATRLDLEHQLVLYEREKLQDQSELNRLKSENEALRERLVRLTEQLSEKEKEAEGHMSELRELRRLREESVAKQILLDKRGPSDAAWLKLRQAADKVRVQEMENETSLQRREASLHATEMELSQRLSEAAERELNADNKAKAAMQAIEAANEATATAEQASSETSRNRARDALHSSLCAVAHDRMKVRRKRQAGGGVLWWEQHLGGVGSLTRSLPNTNERSGVAMLLDAVFLGAGRDGQSHLDSKLPALLRKACGYSTSACRARTVSGPSP